MSEHDDPRIHVYIDTLYVLYLQTNNPKAAEMMDLKASLVMRNIPDIYFIFYHILNQRHLLTVQKSEPRSYPTNG